MRYYALATDYDGTLAHDGRITEDTRDALRRLAASGRKLILVTGRELEDLERTFPHGELFDRIVAENGAVLYTPATRQVTTLAAPPPQQFVDELIRRGVGPISTGHVIVATWVPHETEVLNTIRDLGLELQVIFNKGAVMVLPSGVNKATGLDAALHDLQLSAHNTVGVGDAENDHAFLSVCECAVAVANALPALKDKADYVTQRDHGAGVVELIDGLLRDDLAGLGVGLSRHRLLVGHDERRQPVYLQPYGECALLVGPSGSGKSTFTTALLERLADNDYQFCVVDPEGDYSSLGQAVAVGDPRQGPQVDQVLALVARPDENVVVNLVGLALGERPQFLQHLMPRLQSQRARTGRPHWIVIDEAHRLVPSSRDSAPIRLPQELGGMFFITLTAEHLAADVIKAVGALFIVGEQAAESLKAFCRAAGCATPALADVSLDKDQALLWRPGSADPPVRLTVVPPRQKAQRHWRKYAEGDLGPDRSFYFRGPDNKLNLRAQNLHAFLDMGDGVDEQTWLFHFRRGDFARWFREHIKDETLANGATQLESRRLGLKRLRAKLRQLVESHYTGAG